MTKLWMMRRMAVVVLWISGCRGGDAPPFSTDTALGDSGGTGGDTVSDGDDSSPGESDAPTDAPDTNAPVDSDSEPVCADWNVALDNRPAHVMLLVDVSASMVQDENLAVIAPPNKWSYAKDAINRLVAAKESDITFGLDIFSNAPAGEGDCSVTSRAVVDCEPSSSDTIAAALEGVAPEGKTPLYRAMSRYQDPSHAPAFHSDDARQFLVIVSDGKDTCGLPDQTGDRLEGASAKQLADLARDLRRDASIRTIVIGFGAAIDSSGESQLTAIAAQGGTEFTEYLVASDSAGLDAALDAIAWSVVGCEYELGTYEPNEVDLDKVSFLFDGKKVSFDDGCAENGIGWTWANDDKTAMIFCEGACEMLKDHRVDDLSAVIGCPDIAPVK